MGDWDHQRMLDLYIHDYMKRKNMHVTADIFAQEANVDGDAAVAVEAPEGFLAEWWSLFWDVFSSRFPQANEAVAAPENVPQNLIPIMPRPIIPRRPMSQQTTGTMQPIPFALLPRPELIQQAMNPMQIPFPILPRPELIQQAMNPVQIPFPILPRAEMNQQAMNAMQTPHILPRIEMNQQIMSGMPMSKPDVSANFPASPGFGVQHGEMPTLLGKMCEQEYLKHSPGDLACNFQFLDVEKMTQMLPSSSNSSHQPQISEEIQRQKMFENIQQQFSSDGKHGANLEAAKAAVPIPEGAPQAATVQKGEVFDAGKGKSIQQIPVEDHLLMGVGSFSLGMRQQVLNSPVPLPDQQQQIPAFGGHYQQYHLAKPDGQRSGKLSLSASGSSCNLPSPMPIEGDLSGKVLQACDQQLPGNAQIGGGVVAQQKASGIQIAKETVITEKQQTPKPKQHKLNERVRKRKKSSNVRPVQSTLDGKEAEVQNRTDEDIQLQISHENDNCIDMSAPFSTFLQNSPALDKSVWKGFSFREAGSLNSSNNKLLCCHFTSMGRLLASAGYEKKILLWNMESKSVDVIDGHSDIITDIRFRPNSTVFATSSFDKTLKIWDASKPKRHPSKLQGHSAHVMSLDFHPRKVDLLCSSDSNNEMWIWNVTSQTCVHYFQGGSKQVRFQPRHGDFLASATGNIINLIDVETNIITCQFKGHDKDIHSLCWDTTGTYIASVSEDSARIWAINLGGRCIHELHCSGNKFESCTFHPGYSQLMVIGTYRTLKFWNPTGSNRTLSYRAHDGVIAALTDSPHTETIASAGHDNWLKV